MKWELRAIRPASVLEKLRGLNPALEILPIEDAAFQRYGKVLRGYHTAGLQKLLAARRIAPDRAEYERGLPRRSAAPRRARSKPFARDVFGGPERTCRSAACTGRNAKLNALEYHKSAEVVVVGADMIVFVGLASDIQWPSGSSTTLGPSARPFSCPAARCSRMYPWCLHYAPAHASLAEGFRCAVILPRGTNTEVDFPANRAGEGRLLLGKNKWVLAHAEEESLRALSAHPGLQGVNVELRTL